MLPTAREIILRAARTAKRGGSLCATTAQPVAQWGYAGWASSAMSRRVSHVSPRCLRVSPRVSAVSPRVSACLHGVTRVAVSPRVSGCLRGVTTCLRGVSTMSPRVSKVSQGVPTCQHWINAYRAGPFIVTSFCRKRFMVAAWRCVRVARSGP